MSLFTKLGNDIASPVDANGALRSVDNGDMQRWMTESERLLLALVAGEGGDIDLPNLLIRYSVTGGTADAIEATPNLPLPDAPGEALFSIQIAQDNTGPVTINGKPWKTNVGSEFVAGGIKANGIYLFLDNGDHFRSLTEQGVSALVVAAEAAQLAAESAAGANLSNADSVTAAELTNIPAPVNYVRTAGMATAGDGRSALYARGDGTMPGDFQSGDGAYWRLATRPIIGRTIKVGAGGEFSTVGAALYTLSQEASPAYVDPDTYIVIELQENFVYAEQILLSYGDFSHVIIRSVDPIVTIQRDALTTAFSNQYPAFGARGGAKLPAIEALFEMDGSGDGASRSGIYVRGAGSCGHIGAGFGFLNVSGRAITADRGGVITAGGAIANKCGNRAVVATYGGFVFFDAGQADDAGWPGTVSDGQSAGLYAGDGGTIVARGASAQRSMWRGVYCAAGSWVHFQEGNSSGAATRGIYSSVGSWVSARDAISRNCGTQGVVAEGGGVVVFYGGDARRAYPDWTWDADNSGPADISVFTGGVVHAHGAYGGYNQPANVATGNGAIYSNYLDAQHRILDDGVLQLRMPCRRAIISLLCPTNEATAPKGTIFGRFIGSPLAPSPIALIDAATIDYTTGVLTGTTGVDGRMTISADVATLSLYIENRLGSLRDITVGVVSAVAGQIDNAPNE